MLNTSKNFVKYLDNYDKQCQTKYNRRLLYNISAEYNQSYLDKSHNIALTENINIDPFYQLYGNGKTFTLDKKVLEDISLNKKVEEKEKEKKKYVEITEKIESISDLIDITTKYEDSEDIEYNIDFQSIVKIKTDLESLNNMIGMDKLKENVFDQLLYFVQKLHISNAGGDYKHTVIYGPPGTGKTEIAKIIGRMYSKIGVLPNNKFVKVTRQDLIAGYLGQTAIKTAKVKEDALGGVLFIDEAYSLASGEKEDSFSKECLDTLCESLSNYKNNLMVIIAGYEEELKTTFFRMNKGLNSRFIWRFTMEPYSAIELMQIYKKIVENNEWQLYTNDELEDKWFKKHSEDFKSYGRDMEQLFTYTKICHSRRVYGKDKNERKKIKMDDIKKGYLMFLDNRKEKEKEEIIYGLYV